MVARRNGPINTSEGNSGDFGSGCWWVVDRLGGGILLGSVDVEVEGLVLDVTLDDGEISARTILEARLPLATWGTGGCGEAVIRASISNARYAVNEKSRATRCAGRKNDVSQSKIHFGQPEE
jgi:hypothetical protein